MLIDGLSAPIHLAAADSVERLHRAQEVSPLEARRLTGPVRRAGLMLSALGVLQRRQTTARVASGGFTVDGFTLCPNRIVASHSRLLVTNQNLDAANSGDFTLWPALIDRNHLDRALEP